MYFMLFIWCMLSQFVYNPTYTLCETPFFTWQNVSAPECHRKGVNTAKISIYKAADQSVDKYAVSQSAYVGWHKKSSQHVNSSTGTVKVRSPLRLLEPYVIHFGREITTSGCYDRNFWVVSWLYYSIICACSTIIASSAMWIRKPKSNNKKVCPPPPHFQMVFHIHHMTWW
jgi:hypothetical protein